MEGEKDFVSIVDIVGGVYYKNLDIMYIDI